MLLSVFWSELSRPSELHLLLLSLLLSVTDPQDRLVGTTLVRPGREKLTA